MRTFLITLWLLAAVAVGAYHLGPGQTAMKLDRADELLQYAQAAVAHEKWEEAIVSYDTAMALLPAENLAQSRQIRLEKAKAQFWANQLPEAREDLASLLDELQADSKADPQVVAQAREALGNAQYHMTWLMRLEGLTREFWEPEVEAARQSFRLLAEQAAERGDSEQAAKHCQDLESTILLARMDLRELQGLPLPKQCSGCKSGKCKNPGKNPGQNQPKEKNDARGASSGPPPDGLGS